MNKVEIISKVEGGNLIRNRRTIKDAIKSFEGREIVLTLERKKRKRSLEQNAYFFGVVIPMLQQGLIDVGYSISKEQTHEFVNEKFNRTEIPNEKTGEIISIPGHTSALTTVQFMELISEIQQFAAEMLNVVIPSPNEELTIKFD